jgi:citrate lyase gamma subunit
VLLDEVAALATFPEVARVAVRGVAIVVVDVGALNRVERAATAWAALASALAPSAFAVGLSGHG